MYQLWRKVLGGTQRSGAGFVVPSGGAFDIGLNFRATSGYVTDGANQTYVLPTDTYPTTRGGFTFGWETTTGLSAADRNNTADVRIAGMNYKVNNDTNTATFRLDLPSTGATTVEMGIGDYSNTQTAYIDIQDGTTSFRPFSSPVTTNVMVDATGTNYVGNVWPTSQTGISHTFSTTIVRIVLGGTTGTGDASCIAHLRVHT